MTEIIFFLLAFVSSLFFVSVVNLIDKNKHISHLEKTLWDIQSDNYLNDVRKKRNAFDVLKSYGYQLKENNLSLNYKTFEKVFDENGLSFLNTIEFPSDKKDLTVDFIKHKHYEQMYENQRRLCEFKTKRR